MASRLADIGISPWKFAVPFSLPLSGQNPRHAHCRLAGQLNALVEAVRAAAVTSGRRRSLLVKVKTARTVDPSVFSFSSGTGIAVQARCRYSSIGTPRRVGVVST